MIKTLKQIVLLFDKKDKSKFNFIVVLSFIAAVFEALGLGSFLPLIEYFSGTNIFGTSKLFDDFFTNIVILNEEYRIFFFLFLVFLIFSMKNIFLSFFYWTERKFVMGAKAAVINNLFKRYIYQNYTFHVNTNSSKLIAKLNIETDIYSNCVSYLISSIVDGLLLLILLIVIFYLNPTVSITISIFSALFLYLVYFILKKRTQKLGGDRVETDALRQKTLQQSLDGIKEIIVYDNRSFFIKHFSKLIDQIKNFVFKFEFINKLQKVLIEMIIIISIIFFVSIMVFQKIELSSVTALIGLYLLAIIKIIPSINGILRSTNYLRYSEVSINELYKDYRLELKTEEKDIETKKIKFKNEIIFKNVSYNYSENTEKILDKICFNLKKNEFVGLIGDTGSGKSTIVNLILGLLKPDEGEILCDELNILNNIKPFQKIIGYVPQNIFLLDDTVRNNIGFGIDEQMINNNRILESVKKSSLEKFINGLPKGLDQFVGEKGVKISGGEKHLKY